ncbi:MAG: OsmC family protein [Armatimonadota bacterium]
MPDVTFSIDGVAVNATQTSVTARSHTFLVDEPPSLGGQDTGPNPVEYLLGALSGCLTVAAHMIAKEVGFTIGTLNIHIEGNLDPSGFMGINPNVRAGFKSIKAVLKVKSNATHEQLDKWLTMIEHRCPVSDNIGSNTPLNVIWET